MTHLTFACSKATPCSTGGLSNKSKKMPKQRLEPLKGVLIPFVSLSHGLNPVLDLTQGTHVDRRPIPALGLILQRTWEVPYSRKLARWSLSCFSHNSVTYHLLRAHCGPINLAPEDGLSFSRTRLPANSLRHALLAAPLPTLRSALRSSPRSSFQLGLSFFVGTCFGVGLGKQKEHHQFGG